MVDLRTLPAGEQKRIALIAHDNKKKDLLDWSRWNRNALAQHINIGKGNQR